LTADGIEDGVVEARRVGDRTGEISNKETGELMSVRGKFLKDYRAKYLHDGRSWCEGTSFNVVLAGKPFHGPTIIAASTSIAERMGRNQGGERRRRQVVAQGWTRLDYARCSHVAVLYRFGLVVGGCPEIDRRGIEQHG
jgi:hypothetical protein